MYQKNFPDSNIYSHMPIENFSVFNAHKVCMYLKIQFMIQYIILRDSVLAPFPVYFYLLFLFLRTIKTFLRNFNSQIILYITL